MRVYQIDQVGITIDDQLKWDKHLGKLHKEISSPLFSMKQVKFLTKSSGLTLYKRLVEAESWYSNVWGNHGTSLIAKLQHLQNRVIELVCSESESLDP